MNKKGWSGFVHKKILYGVLCIILALLISGCFSSPPSIKDRVEAYYKIVLNGGRDAQTLSEFYAPGKRNDLVKSELNRLNERKLTSYKIDSAVQQGAKNVIVTITEKQDPNGFETHWVMEWILIDNKLYLESVN